MELNRLQRDFKMAQACIEASNTDEDGVKRMIDIEAEHVESIDRYNMFH